MRSRSSPRGVRTTAHGAVYICAALATGLRLFTAASTHQEGLVSYLNSISG
jgi:hypothetical protein